MGDKGKKTKKDPLQTSGIYSIVWKFKFKEKSVTVCIKRPVLKKPGCALQSQQAVSSKSTTVFSWLILIRRTVFSTHFLSKFVGYSTSM